MAKLADGGVVIQLTGEPVPDAAAITDALSRCGAELFNLEGSPVWIFEGRMLRVNDVVLRDLVPLYVFTKTPVVRGGKLEVVYVPVEIDDRVIRTILTGRDRHPRSGGEIKDLASRLPKVSAASIGMAA
jgi:hypothetical protein